LCLLFKSARELTFTSMHNFPLILKVYTIHSLFSGIRKYNKVLSKYTWKFLQLFYNIEAKPMKPDMEMALRWYGIWHKCVGVDMKRNSIPHFWRSFLKICLEHCDCLTSFGEFPMN
jgi:hypothetical protein